MARTNSTNDMGWWSDPETQDPPYLDPDPGQIGNDVDQYYASKLGFASGQYPDGRKVPGSEIDNDGS